MTPVDRNVYVHLDANLDGFRRALQEASEAAANLASVYRTTVADLTARGKGARFRRRHQLAGPPPTRAQRRAERRRVDLLLRKQRRIQAEVEAASRQQLRTWQSIQHHPGTMPRLGIVAVQQCRRPNILAKADLTGYITTRRPRR